MDLNKNGRRGADEFEVCFGKNKKLLSNVVPLFAFIFSQALDWNHACFKQRSKKGNKMTDMRSIVLSQWAKSIELGCTQIPKYGQKVSQKGKVGISHVGNVQGSAS